jgi:hypothetical protein
MPSLIRRCDTMIRSFDKDKFITILQDRPATIRCLQKPDDKYLARCLNANARVVGFTDTSWLTLPVLQELLSLFLKSSYASWGILDSFPRPVLDSLPLKDLRKLCDKHESLVLKFPNAPYDLFLKYVTREHSNPDFKEIPEQHRTEELLAELFANNYSSGGIPDESFTDRIVDVALDKKPSCINYIPIKFLTRDRLTKAFQKEPSLGLSRDDIPPETWNQELADLATADGNNISRIPNAFITKPMCLRSVSGYGIQDIPTEHIDEDVVLIAMTSRDLRNYKQYIPSKYLKSSFLLKLAQADAQSENKECFGVSNYRIIKQVQPDWVTVLKVCPKALRLIEKSDQTDEIIKAFFENASITVIDSLKNHINLNRLKKEYTPYLIGTEQKVFQDIITRKMVKKPRKDLSKEIQTVASPQASESSVGVDLTDAEYLDIIKKFGQ